MTDKELVQRFRAKADVAADMHQQLVEQLAELPGALIITDDGRDLLAALESAHRAYQHLDRLAQSFEWRQKIPKDSPEATAPAEPQEQP